MTPKAVFWDMDGTLTDSEPLHEAALIAALRSAGVTPPSDLHERVLGISAWPVYEMMRDEFGIDPRVAEESSVRPAIAMALSYAAGSVLPILPFAIPAIGRGALWVSIPLALCGLFAIGYYAASLAGRSPFARGLEIMAWGSAVFAISFLAGHFIPPLFGHAPISLGG